MPSRDEICAVVDSYVKLLGSHQIDELMELFHQGAVQHEPVGVRTNRGFDEIRAFFAESEDTPFTVSLLTPVTVVGKFAAMQMRVEREGLEDFASTDLFEFDDNCKILSITAVPDIKALIP
ncbi:isomerase [Rhodococcus sp. ACPA4]|jgi:steroid delta-isomerase|uniref:Steroid delta-isomerase n=2 Tax=Nocardiaceae TaxID=85025 RepID=A0A652YVK2_NOCGL|nr:MULTISPECIES: nuclear transport factor 2 family protein [Rhodococcus]NMD60530.1 SnoaL-like domain-containing protein [Nocardia globerula]KJF20636.1 Steroid Delta-isomerase [Rhodococcus sp. AD45]MCE4264257.1 nuclear transport factor 2 family protein [Rhodococcus globerulus]MDV6268577.1 nuclear transport factor 2 family protein [Rhodococcus globerulus]NRI65681.1 nuclear transport factor 2 family protein [Rhodococcus sp. MS16]